MNSNSGARSSLAPNDLFVLGITDLARGVFHTFLVNWSARTFAHLDLSVGRQDQLTLLGAPGISNFLTGLIYILISRKAKALAESVLLIIVGAYAIGYIGMKTSGIADHAAFDGKYFMLFYLTVCLVTAGWSRFRTAGDAHLNPSAPRGERTNSA